MDVINLFSNPSAWIVIATIFICILYKCGTANFHFFSDQGIPGPKPIPFFGNTWGIWKKNIQKTDQEMFDEYGKMFGTFDGTVPNLWITDAELIRSVLVKDFDHFVNRRDTYLDGNKIFRKMVGILENKEWKEVRSLVSPSFSTGKIKQYSLQMKECADKLCTNLQSIASDGGKIQLKEELGKVAMSVIAKCAFGMTIQDLEAKDNPFMEKAKNVFNPVKHSTPAVLIPFLLPKFLIKWLSGGLFYSEDFNYFARQMTDLLKHRSQSTEKFHDFPEVFSEVFNSHTKEMNGKTEPMWNNEEVDELVTAQSTIFLVVGFDTTASTLAFCAFHLAVYPEIQAKLYDMLISKIEEYGGVCHEMLQDLPYLDHFINEVLRLFPLVPRLERICNKDVTYDGIHIKKGMLVTVPAFALHTSEEYYSDPKTFNPDRWNAENKANMNSYAYVPFGLGPRNCIAMRFAREELKLVLCTLIQQFRFFPVDETPVKLAVADGFHVITQIADPIVGLVSRV